MDCLKTMWKWMKKAGQAFHSFMKSFAIDFYPTTRYKNPFESRLKYSKEQLDAWALGDFAVTLVKLRLADEQKDIKLLNGSYKYTIYILAKQSGLKDFTI